MSEVISSVGITPRLLKSNHITITQEPEGKYLHHFKLNEPAVGEKPALKEAQGVFNWLRTHGGSKGLKVIGGVSMTGCHGGSIAHLERLMGHKWHWSICMIHTNQLPLRHLISQLDGPTNSRDGFTGPIGKLLKTVNTMKVTDSFPPIVATTNLAEIPDYIKNCYTLTKAIKCGVVSKEVANLKCGPLNHSRWLNTAEALLFLWIKEHGLEGEHFKKLSLLVSYVLDFYLVLYFDIKVKNSLVHGPQHVQRSIQLFHMRLKKFRISLKSILVAMLIMHTPKTFFLLFWPVLTKKIDHSQWIKY